MSPGPDTRYRRSPALVLLWEGTEAQLLHADSLRSFRADPLLVALLAQLGEPASPAMLREAGLPVSDEQLEELAELGIVERGGGGADLGWPPLELAVHRRTAVGAALPPELRREPPPRPRPNGAALPLPVPSPLDVELADVLARRRTLRRYADRPLAAAELSTLLHHAAGVVAAGGPNGPPLRAFAGAGARSELELYVVANRVEGLRPGPNWYDATAHALVPIRARAEQQEQLNAAVDAAAGGALDREPAVILLITAVFERMAAKYGHLALSLVYKDVGCLLQNLYLVSTALGLAPCAIGNGDESANSRWLGLDPLVEPQVGCFLVGPSGDAS